MKSNIIEKPIAKALIVTGILDRLLGEAAFKGLDNNDMDILFVLLFSLQTAMNEFNAITGESEKSPDQERGKNE